MYRLPSYNDGVLSLYLLEDDNGTFPKDKIINLHTDIWFRELNIFDSMKIEYSRVSERINMKIAIPQYREITTRNVIKINNQYYRVYNVSHVKSKHGHLESEITLEQDERLKLSIVDCNSKRT